MGYTLTPSWCLKRRSGACVATTAIVPPAARASWFECGDADLSVTVIDRRPASRACRPQFRLVATPAMVHRLSLRDAADLKEKPGLGTTAQVAQFVDS